MTTQETTAEPTGSGIFEEIRHGLVEFRHGLVEFRQNLAELRVRDRDLAARKDRDHAQAMGELAEIREQQRETALQMKETEQILKETDRIVKETALQMKETDRQMKETDRQMKETDRQMKETDRRLRKTDRLFNTQWGRLMESLVRGDLVSLLKARGVEVNHTQAGPFKSRRNGRHYEVDILAQNGREVVVVEVKTTLQTEHVTKFASKLSELAEWFPAYRGMRVFGGVAYLQCGDSVPIYAERRGLFVIRATGSSASIVNRPDFVPRAFA